MLRQPIQHLLLYVVCEATCWIQLVTTARSLNVYVLFRIINFFIERMEDSVCARLYISRF